MKPKRICAMPYQPGDEKPVRADDPNGPQWGELFGRPRVNKEPGGDPEDKERRERLRCAE